VDLRHRGPLQIVVECVCARIESGSDCGDGDRVRVRAENESQSMMERLDVFCLVEDSPSLNPFGIVDSLCVLL